MKLNSIEEIIDDIRQGKMVILMDDEDRENEGDIIIAAERVQTEDINFMATNARGLICLTLTRERCEHLKLPLMVNENNTPYNTNFTVSIEAASGVTTGISAGDRARTIQVAVGRESLAEDIVQPGHIFPIMAQPGGVLRRAGHTEAGCDLARLAGYQASAAIVEIMNEDGSMARRPDLEKFAEKHQLKIGTIVDLIHYRIANEQTVERVSSNTMETEYGEFDVHSYKDSISGSLHLAFTKGEISSDKDLLVRVHIPNTLRDVCEVHNAERTSWSFSGALKKISEEGAGVAVLLSGNDYGKGVEQNLASALASASGLSQSNRPGNDLTIGTGSQILRDLGVGKMRLLSYPANFNAVSGFDLEVVDFVQFDNSQGE
ncbi:MAG: 3,4-dihydroxy-2-butanone-4-phosphate synthase [Gammaproteobacteria bacterium]|jgi:3,4-dihydroxy 2-butanone 4-phosphate synthase/GTP cyclohydrolase II|nr:3,4-dihydroxy-2-butanone-4-phosphate synthase [Gammaproteobacteria bacterium]MBT3859309.1 3,4-dihydroxy-2-butanone-4-phosphate synthase [Gammaproteobacteria bacterium]MBT3987999.1 3,4-dihydroxy-2-butanone-4-phosphate synthase [Gammaproteobacteria bacterium]MBT4255389.1 3,4-dihydroxy-2-butanone-4-phosphate synthase [Gammaproteobacteria bacterium]MBT4583088.1 3,4-dihydroxy-2-butanone-4-phosphate synthase [Gammaproteobacteria bacterium]